MVVGRGSLLPRSSVFRVPFFPLPGPRAREATSHGLGPLLLKATSELAGGYQAFDQQQLWPIPGEKAGGMRGWKTEPTFGSAVGTLLLHQQAIHPQPSALCATWRQR